MTYNRDLQEDKERLFDTVDTARATLRVVAGMIDNTAVREEACRAAASDPLLLATDLADWLVRKGVAFRQAYHAVGAVVALAEKLNKPLDQLTLEELKSVHERFEPEARAVFDLDRALERREIPGAPGRKEVRKQLARWKRVFEQ